jgi:type IV pilus assembly protein PilM
VRQHHGGNMRCTRSFFSSRPIIKFGLDISSSAVKLLQLSHSNQQYHIQYYGQQTLPTHVMNGNLVQDVPALGQVIQELLIQIGLWSQSNTILQAIIAVPDACTIHKTIQVSERLRDDDLEELVSLELGKCIPDSLDDIYYDFAFSGMAQSGIKTLLITAVRAQYVVDRVAALRHIGLSTIVVDVESLAIQRIMPFLLPQPMPVGLTVMLDLGARCLKVLFFKQTSILFIHDEEFGIANFVFPTQEEGYQEGIWQRFKRACHFFYAEYPQSASISYMLVYGGGAQLPQIIAWLQSHCSYPVARANPLLHQSIMNKEELTSLFKHVPLYLTAFGLAKRGC